MNCHPTHPHHWRGNTLHQATQRLWPAFMCILLLNCGGGSSSSGPEPTFSTKVTLGEALFNNADLSLNRSQSCATCHNLDAGFIDDRLDHNNQVSLVSTGDDGFALGNRNTPTAAYAARTPDFHLGERLRVNVDQATVADYQGAIGGLFLDGRAASLQDQARGPFLNPVEMMMPDAASVVARVLEDEGLAASFRLIYGDSVFDTTETAYDALTDAIAEFERQPQFAPFSSKYDKFLAGEYDNYLLSKAALGEGLFFSQFTNCDTCHQLQPVGGEQETFTGYEYHNIGVPANQALINLKTSQGQIQATDLGLFDHTQNDSDRGKFKVPTLRNSAVTGPYMHNGVFRELATVVRFYDQFNNADNILNPETGAAWQAPEVATNVNLAELEDGDILTEQEIEGLVCFMVSLTDEVYEHLVADQLADCGLLE